MGTDVKLIDPVGLREELKVLTLDKLEDKYEELGFSDLWKKGTNKQIAIDKLIAEVTKQNESVKEVEATLSAKEAGHGESETEEEEYVEAGEYDVDQDLLDEFPYLVEQGYNIGDILVVEEGKPWYRKSAEPIVEKELVIKPEDPAFGTEGITSKKTIEEVDSEIKEDNSKPINPEHITDENDIPPSSSLNEEEYLASVNGVDNPFINGVSRETVNEELANLNGGPVDPSGPETEKILNANVENEGDDLLDGNEVVKEYEPEVIDESKYTIEDIKENIEICQANLKDAIPVTRVNLLRKLEALEAALERKSK